MKLGTLRDHKGGEYMSRKFEALHIDHGIQRHTVRNHPQQNGQRGLIGQLRKVWFPYSLSLGCLQHSGGRGTTFIHTSNRSFTSALPVCEPHEVFHGTKPDLSMFRVWGCTAYVLIERDKCPLWSLVGTQMEKCVFTGYPHLRATRAGNFTIL